MHTEDTIWYRLGYALERARGGAPDLGARLGGAAEPPAGSDPEKPVQEEPVEGADEPAVRALLLGGAGALATRLLRIWPRRHAPGAVGLAAAGASGAAAGLLVELLHPLLRGELRAPVPDRELASSVLSGAGRGLAYGGVVEPRLPGPPFLRGLLYGTVEYMIAPWGGLPGLLGSSSPHRRLPLVSPLLEPAEEEEAEYADFVAFGLALGILYGAFLEKRGITPEE